MISISNTVLVTLALGLPAFACAAARGRSGGGAAPPRTPASRAGDGSTVTAPAEMVEVASASLGALTARKWRLPNGLEVVLVPDPQATSVSYTTWFRVGSRHENERAGETGLAHLFEHLMFTQTKTM